MLRRYLLALALFCLLIGFARADRARADEAFPLYLHAVPALAGPQWRPPLPDALLPGEEARTPRDYIVQFAGPIQDTWKKQLESMGAQLLGYIPDYAFKARLTPELARKLRGVVFVRWVGLFEPEYKLSPTLKTEGRGWYRVLLEKDVDLRAAQREIALLGAEIADEIEGEALVIGLAGARSRDLAALPSVVWIENVTPFRFYNDRAAGEMQAAAAWAAGLSGEGQLLCIADSGLDTGIDNPLINDDMHLDLDNRLRHIASWPLPSWMNPYLNNPGANDGAADLNSGHGTHVTGSAVGNGARSAGLYKGIAYQAALSFQALEQYADFNALGEESGGRDGYGLWGLPNDLGDLFQQAYDWGARVHSNSWGGGAAGRYELTSQQVDRFAWSQRDMVILFAAGNGGRDGNADGLVDAGSVVAPGTAKNALTIGATENLRPVPLPNSNSGSYGSWWPQDFPANPLRDDPMADAGARGMAALSSRGPTQDGRLKPDLVAPGTWVLSTRSRRAANVAVNMWGQAPDAHYMYMGGTSMSTALAAGAATVVREFYVQERGLDSPSAALVKATLINSATPLAGQYPAPYAEAGTIPNNHQGWGALNLRAAVQDSGRGFSDQRYSLYSGQARTFQVSIRSSASPLKITVVWTDYPSATYAAVNLVNDLDLRVLAPDGQAYLGNVFSAGWSVPGGAADRRNNVECVYLQNPPAGVYQITVQAANTPQGPQSFALVYSGDLGVAPTPTPRCVSVSPLDTPAEGALVSGAIRIEGWAADLLSATGTGISRVQIELDSAPLGEAVYGLWRQDIANAWGATFGASGYYYLWDTRATSNGLHILAVRSLSACGWEETARRLIQVRNAPTATPTRPLVIRAHLPVLLKDFPPPFVTPTRTPSPTATPTPTARPAPLYVDDFSNPDSGWPQDDGPDSRMGYLDGEYQILIRRTYFNPVTPPMFECSSCDIAVEARFASPVYGAYGLAFDIVGSTDFYLFMANGQQQYSLFRISSEQWEALADWTVTNALNAGRSPNRLQIVHLASSIALYANAQHLTTLSLPAFQGSIRAGLTATAYSETDIDARFDNFFVYSAGG